ncbi:hypothetical protein [Paraglaciecola sp. T6c]|nr:hypothetical protein [Paraglaciecola sp. T6c]
MDVSSKNNLFMDRPWDWLPPDQVQNNKNNEAPDAWRFTKIRNVDE